MEIFKGTWIQGQDIDYGDEDEHYYQDNHNIILQQQFTIEETQKESLLRIACLGYYVVYINNQKICDDELNNDWTDFTKCVYFDEYKLDKYLHVGLNTIKIELGNGMYNPAPLKLFGKYNLRERLSEVGNPKVICDIINDGQILLSSDASWNYTYGQYCFNNLYLGEKKDLNYHDEQRKPVVTSNKNYNFEKSFIPKIKRFNTVIPKEIKAYKEGIFVDFGEMISGFINISLKAQMNQEITLQYSEHFTNGKFDYSTCLAGSVGEQIADFTVRGGKGAPEIAIQTDQIICQEGLNTFTNQFTYHSFRYAYITGCKLKDIQDLQAIYVHTDLAPVGTMKCSSAELSELYDAALRTKLNNVHSVFEDCARERLGYGGDMVALATSNLYLFDLEQLYKKLIRDFRFEQTENGGIPETAPYMGIQSNGTGQGEGPLLWQLVYPYLLVKHYQYYGDITLLKEELPFVTKQMNYLLSFNLDEIAHKCLGDHGSILIAGQFRKPTPDKLFLGYCTMLLLLKNNIRIRQILHEDYQDYQNKYQDIKKIIIDQFLNKDSSFGEGTQSGYAFAIYLELADPQELIKKFVTKIKQDQGIFNSGIFGMALSYEVLSQYGYNDVIEQWLLSNDHGTYLEMLQNGNQALAELFVGDYMSLNHAMFSSYIQWYYQALAGIQIDKEAVAFNKVTFKPYFSKAINDFDCQFESKQGLIKSTWQRENDLVTWKLEIPEQLDYIIHLDQYQCIDSQDNSYQKIFIIKE